VDLTFLPSTSTLAREMQEMQERFRRAFGERFGTEVITAVADVCSRTELTATTDGLTSTAALPGTKHDQIQMDFEGGVLTIQGRGRPLSIANIQIGRRIR
jgi:HSP20 family molecular chaperone IbpA